MKNPIFKQKIFLLISAAVLIVLAVFTIIAASHHSKPSGNIVHDLSTKSKKILAIRPNITQQPEQKLQVIKSPTVIIPILMYHHIGDLPAKYDATRLGLTVSTAQFENEISWLKAHGYQNFTLNDLYLYSQGKIALPKKPVILTFDDGYDDAFLNAIPILKKYGYTGTFAVITTFPGTTSGSNQYAAWQQIVEAQQQGMEIVCHTENHFDGTNPKFNADYILQNLEGCQKDLKDNLGSVLPFLVYPYGHYNSIYLVQAKTAGFVMGITTTTGDKVNLNDLMELPRFRVNRNETLDRFEEIITGIKKTPPATTTPSTLPASYTD